ncbi:MAG: hypothetical protein RIB45_04120 [Marivibrio sp.]|uniref:hypothetical protein n=1 Tax=Marivibrio sp. TaxID=2039719 RepID=UPI0032EDDDD1
MDIFNAFADWLNALTGFNFSIHGWISVLLILLGVFGLYLGLLALIRRSHRSGHDQAVDDYRDPRRGPPDDGRL